MRIQQGKRPRSPPPRRLPPPKRHEPGRLGRLIAGHDRRVPRLRWRIAGLIGAGVLINYFDRISISVAGPQLESSFHLTPVDLGVLFSAFFWSYALLQIPVGLVVDRLGVTR